MIRVKKSLYMTTIKGKFKRKRSQFQYNDDSKLTEIESIFDTPYHFEYHTTIIQFTMPCTLKMITVKESCMPSWATSEFLGILLWDSHASYLHVVWQCKDIFQAYAPILPMSLLLLSCHSMFHHLFL